MVHVAWTVLLNWVEDLLRRSWADCACEFGLAAFACFQRYSSADCREQSRVESVFWPKTLARTHERLNACVFVELTASSSLFSFYCLAFFIICFLRS